MQRNDGTGGCFPTHYDNPGPPSKRATCILYLNPHWRTGDGGELDLVPFCATPTHVAPRLLVDWLRLSTGCCTASNQLAPPGTV